MKANSNYFLIFCISLFFLAAGCKSVTSENTEKETIQNLASMKAPVQKVLDEQATCWSNGDLACYMEGYWKSDSLVFVGKSGLTYGWQATLDNYKRNYPDTGAMGKLSFEILEMNPLSNETMLVIGKWHLKRDIAAGDLQGHFSVIFKRFPEGWKIIADHSS